MTQPAWGRGKDKEVEAPPITTRVVSTDARPYTPAGYFARCIAAATTRKQEQNIRVGGRTVKSYVGRGWWDGKLAATIIKDDGKVVTYRYGTDIGAPGELGKEFTLGRKKAAIRCRWPDKPPKGAVDPSMIRGGRRFSSQSPTGKSWLPLPGEEV